MISFLNYHLRAFKLPYRSAKVLFVCILCSICSTDSYSQKDTVPLKVGYYHAPPFVEKQENGELTGLSVWLWNQLQEEHHLDYEFVEIPLDEKPLKTTLQRLKSGEIDISLSPLTITSKRNETIAFSQPYFVSNLTVAQKKVSGFKKWARFATSFFSKEFIQTLGVLIGVIFVFGCLVWLFERRRNNEHFEKGVRGMLNGIWWSAVTMTTVGYGDKYPKTWGGKLVALVWMFTTILIISSLTASIASSLTVSNLKSSTSSLDDLKEKKVGTVYSSATEEYLAQHFFNDVTAYNELVQGLKALNKKEVEVFVYDEPYLQHALSKNESLNQLTILPLQFNVELYAFGFKNDLDASLIQQLNHSIIRIKESNQWNLVLNEYNLSEI